MFDAPIKIHITPLVLPIHFDKGGLGALTRLNAGRGNEGRREGVSGGGRQTGRGG